MNGPATAMRQPGSNTPYDVAAVRADFPILARPVYGKRLAFLDSAASAQKPQAVIDAVQRVYGEEYANVHRGLYFLSERATNAFEDARETVARYIGAPHPHEVIFTRNATEAINLVAASWGRSNLSAGDEVLITELEHHANIVPWQLLAQERGIVLRVAPIADDGSFMADAFYRLIGPRTKLVSVAHVSNVLGTVLPVTDIIAAAHAAGAWVLIDGCQAIQHMTVDVRALDCDFYVFSGHKLYGPSGIGALWGREAILEAMPPYMGGGDMIERVSFDGTTFAGLPHKFEAGTPAIAQAIGLAAAIRYVEGLGTAAIAAHEAALLAYMADALASVPGLRLIGTAPGKVSVVSLSADFAHAFDIAAIVDREGVAVRSGHHCAQPLMARMGVEATVRASLGLYSDRQDVDQFVTALERVRRVLG
ncbi:MAG: SufS family cysteine desulfurase [Alphaproteobacteria bacterium]|nr:SufS family cysteine desulfurase [Alphaproteobacteria bacterium]